MLYGHVYRHVKNTLLVAASTFTGWYLQKKIGQWPAVAVWSILTALICMAGGIFFRLISENKVTWTNYAAGICLPWGNAIGRGKLMPIIITSWIIWIAIGAAAIFALGHPAAEALVAAHPTDTHSKIWSVSLLAAWIVDGMAIVYLLGIFIGDQSLFSRGSFAALKIMIAVSLLIVGSIALRLTGHIVAATLLAGGPPLIVGIVFALMIALLMSFGRNMRWN